MKRAIHSPSASIARQAVLARQARYASVIALDDHVRQSRRNGEPAKRIAGRMGVTADYVWRLGMEDIREA